MANVPFDNPLGGSGISRRQWTAGALLAVLAAPLAACGGSPLETFDLSASATTRASARGRGQLAIAEPLATAPTDSDRIVVRPTPETVATLKGAQWTENLPRLLQTRLVQSFENSHYLRAVGRAGSGIVAAHSLTSEIRRFEIDVASGQAIVELSVKLVAEPAGRIVAARVFSASVPGSAASGTAATAALDAALGQTLRDIVDWSAAFV